MDEPDAPPSFVSSLALVSLLDDLARAGAQVVVATHSPIIAAMPSARLLELGDWSAWNQRLRIASAVSGVPCQ